MYFFVVLTLLLSLNFLIASTEVDFIEKQEIVNGEMDEARAYLAGYYCTAESGISLSNILNANGYSAFRYVIPSLDVSGTITNSATGWIVEEDITCI